MILDARKGDRGWRVWDCIAGAYLSRVVRVDDQAATVTSYTDPYFVIGDELGTVTEQRERVEILEASRLVLLDPHRRAARMLELALVDGGGVYGSSWPSGCGDRKSVV